jgi:hypothetical protein
MLSITDALYVTGWPTVTLAGPMIEAIGRGGGGGTVIRAVAGCDAPPESTA